MIDFIKAELKGVNKNHLEKTFEFTSDLNRSTGELSDKMTATFKGLKIVMKSKKYFELQGSLHKFKNDGFHNHDQFTFSAIKDCLNILEDLLQIQLKECWLRNLELGVNLKPPIESSSVVDSLLVHKGSIFRDAFIQGGNLRVASHNRYRIKVYDKALQYRIEDSQIMRYEHHYSRMHDVNMIGLQNLSHLKDKDKLHALSKQLQYKWNEIILFDPTLDFTLVPSNLKNVKCHQWSNPYYWLDVKRHQRHKERRLFKDCICRYSRDIQSEIGKRIGDKVTASIEG